MGYLHGMIHSYHSYTRASMYEALMKRAYRTARRSLAKGIDNSIYLQLVDYIPNGYSLTETKTIRQLEKVRGFLLKGVDRILKFRLTDAEARMVHEGRAKIRQAQYEDDIFEGILQLLDATDHFR